MITPPNRKPRYSQGTIASLDSTVSATVIRDGQTAGASAVIQYASPKVGDRVMILTLGARTYLTGPC